MATLFRNKTFMPNEMTKENASKFVITKNYVVIFSFFISCTKMKNEKNLTILCTKNVANFGAFRMVISSSIKILFMKSVEKIF